MPHPSVRWTFAIIFLVLAAGALFAMGAVHAQTPPPPGGTFTINPTAQMDGMLNVIYESSRTWTDTLRRHANYLFWTLVGIQFVWTFFPLVFKQADFSELIGELVRFVLIIGFFALAMDTSKGWTGAIIDSFQELGFITLERGGSNIPQALAGRAMHPGLVFGTAIEVAYDINEMVSELSAEDSMARQMVFFSLLTIVMCFVFIAGFMALALIESWLVINVAVLFMGLGGSQWTRHYARQMLVYAFAVGVKLFVMTLLIGLIMSRVELWRTELVNIPAEAALWTVVGLSMLATFFVKTIPELAQGLITGAAAGGSSVAAMENSTNSAIGYPKRYGGGAGTVGVAGGAAALAIGGSIPGPSAVDITPAASGGSQDAVSAVTDSTRIGGTAAASSVAGNPQQAAASPGQKQTGDSGNTTTSMTDLAKSLKMSQAHAPGDQAPDPGGREGRT